MSQEDRDRLTRLERRVAELENRLGVNAVQPVVPPSPIPAPIPAPVAPVAAVAAAPTTTSRPASSRSFADLEEQLSSRLLAWVGGIALVLGAMFFLSLAFSRGWIGPEARVLIGLFAGAVALAAGAWLFDRGNQTPATVLTGVGVGTGALALFAASRLYGFIPVEAALLSFFVLAVMTAAIALRANSQAVAAFGIVATTLAPPVLGATPNLVTVAFLAAALIGTALISLGRSWPWLALIAFLATAPQAASWFRDEPSTTLALAAVFAFWATNALAASGRALVGDVRKIHRASVTLLALNALFAIAAIRIVLPDDPFLRSAALVALAGAHGLLALELLLRIPRRHPFGVLAAGFATGVLAIGIAIELGGVARPLAHTALAVAVAFVAIRFRDRMAAAWAGLAGSLALYDFFELYPTSAVLRNAPEGWPFASPEGIVAIVVAAAALLTAVVAWRSFSVAPLRNRRLTPELALASGGIGAIALIAYASPVEFRADAVVIAWSVLAIAAFGLASFVRRDALAWIAAAASGATLVGIAALEVLTVVAPTGRLAVDPDRAGSVVPLLNGESVALVAIAAALLVAAWLFSRRPPTRPPMTAQTLTRLSGIAAASAGTALVYLVSIAIVDALQARLGSGLAPDEIATQAQVALSIAWVLIGAAAFATGLVRRVSLFRVFGLGLLSAATIKVFLFDLSSLDVAYRVLSFIGLGGVLLASSFVAARFRTPGRAANAEPAATSTSDATAATDAGGA
jgi:uncharacterized membrane protein